jgi:hypothetical protein
MRKYIVVLVTMLFKGVVLGQAPDVVPFKVPMSPTAWEYTKFSGFDIDLYKGLANIEIPLYTFQEDKFSLPIELNYYSGGIRVNEKPGIVGLGWSMNMPVIVQNVRGKDDFSNNNYRSQRLPPFQGNPVDPVVGIHDLSTTLGQNGNVIWNIPPNSVQSLPDIQDIPYFTNIHGAMIIDYDGKYDISQVKYQLMFINQLVDTEPDSFELNLNGEVIKFITSENLSPTVQTNINYSFQIINGKNEYKIEPIYGTVLYSDQYRIKGIKVTDPSGIQYFFKTIEGNPLSYYRTVSFKLTKVITELNTEINFLYRKTDLIRDVSSQTINCYVHTGTNETVSGCIHAGHYSNGGINNSGYLFNIFSPIGSTKIIDLGVGIIKTNYQFLESIETATKKVNFIYGGREDYLGMEKLENIEIINQFNQRIKNITLNYDYFTTNEPLPTTLPQGDLNSNEDGDNELIVSSIIQRLNKRLKLTSIQIDNDNPYFFEYYDVMLPSKISYSIDYWGFYNGKPNTSLVPNIAELGFPSYTTSSNDFKANINYSKACTLNKIVYPTKGYVSFEHESHIFDNFLYNTSSLIPVINQGAGLRIKKISTFNHDNQLQSSKRYLYEGGKCISKNILTFQSYLKQFSQCPKTSTRAWENNFISVQNDNFINKTIDTEGNYIGYDKVTTIHEGVDKNYKIENYFANNDNLCIIPSGSFISLYPYYIPRKNTIKNGKLLNEKHFNSDNVIVTEKIFRYENKIINSNRYGMKMLGNGLRTAGHSCMNSNNGDCEEPMHVRDVTLCTFYPIFDRLSLLKEEIVNEYSIGNAKSISTNYLYDNYNNLTNVKKVDNNAIVPQRNISEVAINYSNSYSTAFNILNLPSQVVTKENNIVKEKRVYSYEQSSTNSAVLIKNIISQPSDNSSLNKNKIYYDLYDSDNNLLEFHQENGIYTCIIWGYNKTLPIAKLENVRYASIPVSTINDLQNKSNLAVDLNTENTLKTSLNALRGAFPNAMITTYTHKPLVGVSTITDAKADCISYFYDESGRLLYVKDKDGNILTENEYNYKP